MQPESNNAKDGMTPWEPERHLSAISSEAVRYSRGFSRCKPERWFPGFEAHWLALGNSLGIDFKVQEVKPVLSFPPSFSAGFAGSIDNEPVGIFIDESSSKYLFEPLVPTAGALAQDVVLEYLARRFLSSLGSCWSGPESSVVKFEPEGDAKSMAGSGGIKFQLQINGNPATIWIVFGRFMLDRFDGLWRRQIHSTTRTIEGNTEVHLEVTQLAVPPSRLVEYVRAGTAVDLEVPITDSIILRSKGKPWLPAKLRSVDGKLAVETIAGQATAASVPEGTTRLSICLGSIMLDGAAIAEVAQPGAAIDTGLTLSNRAVLLINNEKVGEANLCVYEGRFAITVV